MKNLFLSLSILLFVSCSSSDDETGTQNSETLSTLLTQNAWVFDRTEIVEITNYGSLNYAEAEEILLNYPLNSSNSTLSITSFDSDGTGTTIYPNNNNVGTTNFGWIILPDNTLRIFLSSNLQNLGVYEFTVNNVLLIITDDREYLYQGTLIKYRAKGNYNKQ